MMKKKRNNEAKCAIALCVVVCISLIVWCGGYFYNHLSQLAPQNEALSNWYNFSSPIIAIANVLAFIGLTIAIYIGESDRQKTHEQFNIQNTIISKLQYIERELASNELTLRTGSVRVMHLYTIYIVLYRCENYFKNLPSLSIIEKRKEEKENAAKIVKQVQEGQAMFLKGYQQFKQQNRDFIDSSECKEMANKLNLITAYLEEYEMSILQDISINIIENPK